MLFIKMSQKLLAEHSHKTSTSRGHFKQMSFKFLSKIRKTQTGITKIHWEVVPGRRRKNCKCPWADCHSLGARNTQLATGRRSKTGPSFNCTNRDEIVSKVRRCRPMLTPKSEHTEFEDDPGGNVEPVQSRRDHVRHVAPPREQKDKACRSPQNT